jgi:heme-degrading monooxygenase HmoA
MIHRIVTVTLKEDKINDFVSIFNNNKKFIENMKGCLGVELLINYHKKNILYTYSFWENLEDLNNYRNSDLFSGIWPATKLTFEQKAKAVSLIEYVV